ncbi:MAG: hypothetical protein IJW24_01325 [Clostridia bacterium]|nr:hypothetical protein [Clostridia bacterium]
MKISKKEFYTIEEIEKYLLENFNVKRYKKLADAYPANKDEWLENYDDVLTYTDGAINGDDYYLFVTQSSGEADDYNEIFLMCSNEKHIPDRMFIYDPIEKTGKCVSEMIDVNIKYLVESESHS